MKVSFTAEVVSNRSPIDGEIAQLHRDATAYKDGKNWDEAVACLKRANELMVLSGTSYGVDRWLRLPIFLQQAGKMDEADMSFSWLLSDVDRQIEADLGQQSTNVKAATKHGMCAAIYDKWRLAWKREKQPVKAEYYEALAKEQLGLATQYRSRVELERKQRLANTPIRERQRTGGASSTWQPSVSVEIINKTLDSAALQDKRYATVSRSEQSSSGSPKPVDVESVQSSFALLIGVCALVLIVALVVWMF